MSSLQEAIENLPCAEGWSGDFRAQSAYEAGHWHACLAAAELALAADKRIEELESALRDMLWHYKGVEDTNGYYPADTWVWHRVMLGIFGRFWLSRVLNLGVGRNDRHECNE